MLQTTQLISGKTELLKRYHITRGYAHENWKYILISNVTYISIKLHECLCFNLAQICALYIPVAVTLNIDINLPLSIGHL